MLHGARYLLGHGLQFAVTLWHAAVLREIGKASGTCGFEIELKPLLRLFIGQIHPPLALVPAFSGRSSRNVETRLASAMFPQSDEDRCDASELSTAPLWRLVFCFLSCFWSHLTGTPMLGPQVPAAFMDLASLVLASFRSCFASLISFHLSVGHGFAVLRLIASDVRYILGPTSRALVRP